MKQPELSVCVDDFKREIRAALETARQIGFRRVDISAVSGAVSPEELSQTGRRHFAKHLADLGLQLGSLRGPADGRGFDDPERGERRLEGALRVLELAAALRTPVVSTTLGFRAVKDDAGASARIQEALAILADRSDSLGVYLAIEASGTDSDLLNGLLQKVNCPWLKTCCDTGTMIMQGGDPHRLADQFSGRIQLVRARDATAGSAQSPGQEVAFGQGVLDPPRLLASLVEAGFSGDIVLTRTTGSNPIQDLASGRAAFKSVMQMPGY